MHIRVLTIPVWFGLSLCVQFVFKYVVHFVILECDFSRAHCVCGLVH